MLKNKMITGLVAVGLLTAATTASALTLGTIPNGASNEFITNSALLPAGTLIQGYYGAQVNLIAGSNTTITVDYFGSEAGFVDSFTLNGSSLFSTPGTGNVGVWGAYGASPIGTTTASVAPGVIDFSFLINGILGVTNGSNPDDATGMGAINFFASFDDSGLDTNLTDGHALFGQSLLLFLDDAGAGPDDNHDDMVIRLSITDGDIQIVPEPSILALLGLGLLGMGLSRRRA